LLCHVLEYWTQNKFFTFAHSLTAKPQNLLREKKGKQEKKTLKVKIKQLFNNMNCTKLVHLQLQKLRCIDFKGSYINSAKTYCQSTIVADIWSSILLLLITVCQLGLK